MKRYVFCHSIFELKKAIIGENIESWDGKRFADGICFVKRFIGSMFLRYCGRREKSAGWLRGGEAAGGKNSIFFTKQNCLCSKTRITA